MSLFSVVHGVDHAARAKEQQRFKKAWADKSVYRLRAVVAYRGGEDM